MSCLMKLLIVLLLILLNSCLAALGGAPGAWTLDDFEDGDLVAAPGLSWVPLSDDLVGGASEARLVIAAAGGAPPRRALRLAGRRSGRPGSFLGAWVPLDGSGRSVSLRAFEGIRLRVKGEGRLQVGFRGGMVNYMAEIDAGTEWRAVEIPFASLAPQGKAAEGARFTPDAVHWFGVSLPSIPPGEERAPGDVSFEVDDVVLYGSGTAPAGPVASGAAGPVAVVPFTPAEAIPSAGWVHLADDPERDGKVPSLPDATRLEAIPSSADGMLWVRVTLREPSHDRWIGMNVVLDVDGDPSNGTAWWGGNAGFKFDRLVTVWCLRVEAGCQGYVGVADAAQAAAGTLAPGTGGSLRFAVDRGRRAFVVGVPRDALHLGKADVRLVAAVGSALIYADDVPGEGAAALR